MHIVFVHGRLGTAGLAAFASKAVDHFLFAPSSSPNGSRMTQNAANRGNPGQVAALKEGYTARTLLHYEEFSPDRYGLRIRTRDGA